MTCEADRVVTSAALDPFVALEGIDFSQVRPGIDVILLVAVAASTALDLFTLLCIRSFYPAPLPGLFRRLRALPSCCAHQVPPHPAAWTAPYRLSGHAGEPHSLYAGELETPTDRHI